jgi:hypothetical protein
MPPRPLTHRSQRSAEPERIANPRAVALAVAVVLLLQIALSSGRMGLPFLDGRFHYNYDNALFSVFARNGILLGGARSQLGITRVQYESWGHPAGPPSYYTHHPFLFKAAFQLWVRLFGDAEFSSRAFSLIVSMIAAAGVASALAIATGSALAACLGTAVMVATPLFATYQLCIKYELDGMAIGAWLLAATFHFLRRPSRGSLAALFILAVLTPLAHWTAVILLAALVLWLAAERVFRSRRETEQPLLALTAGASLGGILLLAAFTWLRGGWAPLWEDLSAVQVHRDVSALGRGDWAARQRTFIALNFTPALAWIAGLLAVAHGVVWATRRGTRRPSGGDASAWMLLGFFLCTLATASVWVFGLPHASFIHHFLQLWYVLPLAALVASTAWAVGRRRRWRVVVAVGTGILITWLSIASTRFSDRILSQQLGRPEDVVFLRSLRAERFDRFVFLPTTRDPLNLWFTGPIFEYYTARPVTYFDRSVTVVPGDKILMLQSEGRVSMLPQIDSLLGIRLENERCGTGLCAYDVGRPQAP